jgi:Glycosyl hydrolase catalytic core
MRLVRADSRLAALATRQQPVRHASGSTRAPGLRVVGHKLSWHRVRHAKLYVVVRKVPAQPDQYLVTRHASIRPPAVPGQTVRYSARTAVAGSAWAPEVAIGYSPPGRQRDRRTAPTLQMAGGKLRWNKIGHVKTYVLVASSPGRTRFTEVRGTSVTPARVQGATVNYSVRTAVRRSAWAVPAAINSTPPAPPPAPAPSGMVVGLNAGNFGTSGAADVKNAVSYVRLDSTVGGSAVRNFTNAGVKVDLDFSGPYNTAGIGALDPGTWANNTLSWYGANCSPAACPMIEVLNEPYWPKWWGASASSQANADAYARLLKATSDAFHARYGASAPKILASCEDQSWNNYWCDEWRKSAAVPNPLQYVDGVTAHPYGGTSNRTLSAGGSTATVNNAHAASGKPVYVTEVGWPTATQCPSTGDSFQWSQAEQAANITRFIDWARSTGYVAAVMYFNYRDFGSCDWYGVESQSGAHKLGYDALKAEAAK